MEFSFRSRYLGQGFYCGILLIMYALAAFGTNNLIKQEHNNLR